MFDQAERRSSVRAGRGHGIGGEPRVALALAAVAGGETLVFDEIDAGIGGRTAHRVAETLAHLAGRAQVITITHLPQTRASQSGTSGSKSPAT